jgi:hypothetical protein
LPKYIKNRSKTSKRNEIKGNKDKKETGEREDI